MTDAMTLPSWMLETTASARYMNFRDVIEPELAARRPRELDEDDQSMLLLPRGVKPKTTRVTAFKRERKAWRKGEKIHRKTK